MKLWLALFACVLPAMAAEQGADCRTPEVFPDAAVNAVVLPFEYMGTHDVLERSQAAQRLSLLLQRNILFLLLKYPSIASVQLVKRGTAGCEPDVVIDQLLGKRPGAARRLGPSKAAVFLWGMLYEEGDALYVRSYLRLVRNNPDGEQLAMKVEDVRFTGAMPLKTVAFPPARIAASELKEIDQQFRAFNTVRFEPSDSAFGSEIPFFLEFPFAYTVGRVQGEWMYIQPLRTGPSGWVKAGASLSELPLPKKLPELSFLEGVVAYVFAANAGPNSMLSPRWMMQALEAMKRFVADAKLPEDAPVQAWVATVRAAATLMKAGNEETWGFAQAQFQRASELAPADPDLEHMDLLCRIWLTYKGVRRDSPRELAAELRDVASKSDDPRVLSNLEQFYRLMIAKGQADDSVRDGLARVEKIRAAVGQR